MYKALPISCPVTALALAILLTPTVALAAQDASTGKLPQIYTSSSYTETDDDYTGFRTRGFCTDAYSKEWCDAHGFSDNRPVPHKVKLTPKEERCLQDFYVHGAIGALGSLVTGSAPGALFATASVAYDLFRCLS